MAEDHYQKKRSMKVFAAIDEEIFSPSGFHALVVDDDIIFLADLERMLRQCDYNGKSTLSYISFIL